MTIEFMVLASALAGLVATKVTLLLADRAQARRLRPRTMRAPELRRPSRPAGHQARAA